MLNVDYSLYRGIVIEVDDTPVRLGELPHSLRVKVRIPQLHGGSNSPTRVDDSQILLGSSIIPLTSSDVGSIVVVGFEDGDKSNMIVLGKVWMV